jgi:hypothetical protein
MGIHIQTHRLKEDNYMYDVEIGLSCHYTHTKLYEDLFRLSGVDRGRYRYIYFPPNKESRLEIQN